jgi:hypothetical protein
MAKKKKYRKPVLRRLGLLRQVTRFSFSEPHQYHGC